jgi:hypothetical protein
MSKKIVGSTFSCNNIYEVLEDNSNHYRSIMMDAMSMDLGYSSEGSRVDKESNVNVARVFFFFYLLRDFYKPLCDEYTN